jgi:hypothetical protein
MVLFYFNFEHSCCLCISKRAEAYNGETTLLSYSYEAYSITPKAAFPWLVKGLVESKLPGVSGWEWGRCSED